MLQLRVSASCCEVHVSDTLSASLLPVPAPNASLGAVPSRPWNKTPSS
jgi:hypothetical protein